MPDAVRERLLTEHRPALERVFACADFVATQWDGDSVTDSAAVVAPFRRALQAADGLEPLAFALADSVAVAGYALSARPVPAPPYVVVTSRGVLLRATLPEGRLVATVSAFEVAPYRRSGTLPEALTVEHRR